MKTKAKILLIIDQEPYRESLSRELEKRHYHLTFPKDDAIQKVFDEVPHLILIDENFNGGEGKQIAISIKEDMVLKHIPLVLLTRPNEVISKKEASKIDYYVKKEDDFARLLVCVRKALAKNYNELDLNPLTHLPGARSSVLCIERAARGKKPFAVCSIDLSDLSVFNSAYGDARGDEIIAKLGKIIQDVLKKEGSRDDFVGHLGGDDFIVVTASHQAVAVSEAVIRRFDETIMSFYDPHDRKLGYIIQKNREGLIKQYPVMSVSIAIVQSDVASVAEISEIGRIAAELKKRMKSIPGSCYFKYEPETVNKNNGDKFQKPGVLSEKYAASLQSILSIKKINAVYQPIIDLKNQSIIGYEALARVKEGALNDASLLFAVARDSNKIKELDRLCVECALNGAQAIEGKRKLFLNLNQETLIDTKIMKKLFENKGKIDFQNIVIEVTEQSILRSFDKMKTALLGLKEQGVSVAIDDVGGGAVSLRDVAILKPDYIKFDRSLIRQIDSNITKQQIVLSMILFANGIHAVTTAEGIETEQEYKTVLMCGITLGQGYYFARPGEAFPLVSEKNK